MSYTATYSPEDNKLRFYGPRLSREDYERAKKAGYHWAPKQDLLFAAWSPTAEDFALEFASEIEDEDKSLVDRAEERAERFEDYSDSRTKEANQAHAEVSRIADGIPLGQPILVGHHSERHARKDAERIENGMRKAVNAWKTAQYWRDRAAGALAHAKYKERPDVRARRIKALESELRRCKSATFYICEHRHGTRCVFTEVSMRLLWRRSGGGIARCIRHGALISIETVQADKKAAREWAKGQTQ